MSIRSEIRYCPHCGAPYPFNPPFGGAPFPTKRRCCVCGKIIPLDIFGIGNAVGVMKHTKKTLKQIKKIVDWLAS